MDVFRTSEKSLASFQEMFIKNKPLQKCIPLISENKHLGGKWEYLQRFWLKRAQKVSVCPPEAIFSGGIYCDIPFITLSTTYKILKTFYM